jgi:hypothetical protein
MAVRLDPAIALTYKPPMKPPVALLLVLGVILGPVYYGYCLLFSGKVAQSRALTERADRWITPDGAILRFHGGLGYKPVLLELHPDMNLVTLRLRFSSGQARRDDDTTKLQYQASLLERDHTVLQRSIAIELRPGKSHDFDIGPVEIPYPAQYLVLLEEAGKPAAIPEVTLQVVEKVEKPNMPVAWTGVVLLVVAFVFQLHALWSSRRATPGS